MTQTKYLSNILSMTLKTSQRQRLSTVPFSLLIQGLSSPIISRSCDAAQYGTTVMHIKIDCHLQSPAGVSVNVHFHRMGQCSNWHAAAFAHWILNWDLQVTHHLRTVSHMSISYSLSSPHSHTANFEQSDLREFAYQWSFNPKLKRENQSFANTLQIKVFNIDTESVNSLANMQCILAIYLSSQ